MVQLLAHLTGDYVLQNHFMATKKTSSPWVALLHAVFYGIPFLLLVSNPLQWFTIVVTHAVIDHFRLAGYWCRLWGVGSAGWMKRWTGDVKPPPPFLSVWLLIIVDNTMHMAINFLALRFL